MTDHKDPHVTHMDQKHAVIKTSNNQRKQDGA